jgi:hypothetical protein
VLLQHSASSDGKVECAELLIIEYIRAEERLINPPEARPDVFVGVVTWCIPGEETYH